MSSISLNVRDVERSERRRDLEKARWQKNNRVVVANKPSAGNGHGICRHRM